MLQRICPLRISRFTTNIPLFLPRKMYNCQSAFSHHHSQVSCTGNVRFCRPSQQYYDYYYGYHSYQLQRGWFPNNNNQVFRPNYYQQPYVNYRQSQRKVHNLYDLSKKLAYILRHGAFKMKLYMNESGYVSVRDILNLPDFRHLDEKDIIGVVQNNNKRRFQLQYDRHANLLIAATQGHSLRLEKLELCPITDAQSYPCVIHGTTYAAWHFIRHLGLKRMGRTHIHFTSGEPGDRQVISGMRSSSQVLIYIDLKRALAAGIKFFLSKNEVILSEGNEDGTISPVFFKVVIDRNTRNVLYHQNTNNSS